MIKAAVFGASGYSGGELVRLLSRHPQVTLSHLVSQSHAGQPFGEVFANFSHRRELACADVTVAEAAKDCDVVFLAMPHGVAAGVVTEEVLGQAKVVDLGADFRFREAATYEQWYGVQHAAPGLLGEAVYGLTELNRARVTSARLVANPGCYTTCGILTVAPLLRDGLVDAESVIIDAKSGASGAGRGAKPDMAFCECDENVSAYGVTTHRHTPEFDEELSAIAGQRLAVTFTPHLVPMNRGILATVYAKPAPGVAIEQIRAAYERLYGDEFFVRLTKPGVFPQTSWVKGSNFCDIGVTLDERTNTVVAVGALDNLGKGAAGQAVQNMNLMFGFDERSGLDDDPVFPA